MSFPIGVQRLAWLTALLALALGAAFTREGVPAARVLGAAGFALLVASVVRSAAPPRRAPLVLLAVGAGSLVHAGLPEGAPSLAEALALAVALPLGFALAGWTHPRALAGRWIFPAIGGATAAAGTILIAWEGTAFATRGWLMVAGGANLLALDAYWTLRQRGRVGGERPFLFALVVSLVATAFLAFAPLPEILRIADPWRAFATLGALGTIGMLAVLTRPVDPGSVSKPTPSGGVLDALAHGGAAIGLLNVLFLAYAIVAGWSVRFIFAALVMWQALAVTMEYRTVRHADRVRRTRGVATAAPPFREPITVVVPAMNDARVLRESLAHNLHIDLPLRFLVVASLRSRDDTLEVAREASRRHPGRVEVVEGLGASKADDLNLAWARVSTEVALILDADERTDAESIRRGMARLARDPAVGVVQGRKVSAAAQDGPLARFVSAERRYSTRMDHAMHADTFGSAHFAGSAALVRREAALAVGGWNDLTMTEDIEFSLRLHLRTEWRIAYEPGLVVRECDPQNLRELVRQRTRWARGWTECFALYFGEVLRRREAIGRTRAFGLAWLLLTPVSALWSTLLPAMLVLRLAGFSHVLPLAFALPLAVVVLPSRLLGYSYAALADPVIPIPRTPRRVAELVLHAYLWVLFGWFVQLHALYLELSQAPRVWYVTGKKSERTRSKAPAATNAPSAS